MVHLRVQRRRQFCGAAINYVRIFSSPDGHFGLVMNWAAKKFAASPSFMRDFRAIYELLEKVDSTGQSIVR